VASRTAVTPKTRRAYRVLAVRTAESLPVARASPRRTGRTYVHALACCARKFRLLGIVSGKGGPGTEFRAWDRFSRIQVPSRVHGATPHAGISEIDFGRPHNNFHGESPKKQSQGPHVNANRGTTPSQYAVPSDPGTGCSDRQRYCTWLVGALAALGATDDDGRQRWTPVARAPHHAQRSISGPRCTGSQKQARMRCGRCDSERAAMQNDRSGAGRLRNGEGRVSTRAGYHRSRISPTRTESDEAAAPWNTLIHYEPCRTTRPHSACG